MFRLWPLSFYVTIILFLLETLVHMDFGHPLFPTTIEDKLGLLAPMVHGCIPSFEHFIGKQIE